MSAYLNFVRLVGLTFTIASLVIGSILALESLFTSHQLLVVGESRELQVTDPCLEGKGSSPQETTSLCARIHIHGFSRFGQMFKKYTHSLKLIVNASTAGKTSKIHVCCHLIASREIGMCPHYLWKEVIHGSWIARMSPFNHKILDVRVASSSSNVTLKVSTIEESFMYRPVLLIVGTLLLIWASTMSRSLEFYCTCSLTVGLILVFLLLLFQIIKRLPTRPSFWAFFLYSSLVGVTYVSLPHIPDFLLGLPRELGLEINEENRSFMLMLRLPVLHMIGLQMGLPAMHSQLLKAQDGSIDNSTSLFISWSIWIMAALLILQSSGDALLAGGALIFVIVMSPMLRRITISIFPKQIVMYLLLQTRNGMRYALGETGWAVYLDFIVYRKAGYRRAPVWLEAKKLHTRSVIVILKTLE